MKKVYLSFVLFLLFTQTSLYALVPEPDVTIYGTVYNHYKGADTILHNGNMQCHSVRKKNDQTKSEPSTGHFYANLSGHFIAEK